MSKAPIAPRHEHVLRHLDHERIDPYYYMRDKENPEVLDYLRAENAYTAEVLAPTQALQETIYHEILSRIQEDDQSYPTLREGYYYYTQTKQGAQYPLYWRMSAECFEREWSDRPLEVEGGELLFDVNAMAEGKGAFIFAGYQISPSGQKAAYFANETGSYAEFTLHIRDLSSGKDLGLTLEGIASLAWAEDDETIYYSRIDETLRSSRIYRQRISGGEAELIYEEADARFSCSISQTKTREYLFITSASSTSSEEYYLLPTGEDTEPKLFLPRAADVTYSILSHKERLYIYYKDKEHLNGMLYTADKGAVSDRTSWQLIIPHRESVKLDGIQVYRDYIVLDEREGGLSHLRLLSPRGEQLGEIAFPDPAYTISLRGSADYAAERIRYSYSSPARPSSLYEYTFATGQSRLLKQQQVGGGFRPEDYVVERRWATSSVDGVQIPVVLLYRRGLQRDGSAPALLYGYGSYGITLDASFSVSVLSLVDRGFVYALAQVRGGSELGEQWYESGKFLHKRNTFTDFIDCAELLVSEGYTRPEHLAAQGGSAGGLLIGAVANMRPDLFHSLVAQVPFVDVVTTMLDESLPLTTGEYEEWGNPNERKYYDYMLSYSPYDNLGAHPYPAMLITGGLNDSQVLFHEPAKYTAKLRSLRTDGGLTLLHMNMESGHGGATGRYNSIRDTALIYAFLIMTLQGLPK